MQCSNTDCSLKDGCERFQEESPDSFKQICDAKWNYRWFIQKDIPTPVKEEEVVEPETKDEVKEEQAVGES